MWTGRGARLAVVATLACCSVPMESRRVLTNPALGHDGRQPFANGYVPRSGPTPYDDVDFLSAGEKEEKRYWDDHGDGANSIDRVRGFRPADFQQPLDWEAIRHGQGLRVTWLGHAAFLVQLGGMSIATDPVLTDLPAHWLMDELERISPPVVSPRELSFVDAVVVSHNHYDHLDFETLAVLPRSVRYFVPLRTGRHFGSGYPLVTDMDWYTSADLGAVRITFVPAQHWSNRTFWDRNEDLWGGFVLEHGGRTVYFAGDTGYSRIFDDIHARTGDIDVCLLPIISYRPVMFRRNHMTPEWAVDAAVALHCKTVVPWGYGTFILGNEHVLEPLRRLERARADIAPTLEVRVLKMGETATFGSD